MPSGPNTSFIQEGTAEGTDLTASSLQQLTKQLNRRKRKRKDGQAAGAVAVQGAEDLTGPDADDAEGGAADGQPAAAAATSATVAGKEGSDSEDEDEDDVEWGGELDGAGESESWEQTVLPAEAPPAKKTRRREQGAPSASDTVVDLCDDDGDDDEPAAASGSGSGCAIRLAAAPVVPPQGYHSREFKAPAPGKCRFMAHVGPCSDSDSMRRFLNSIKANPYYSQASSHTYAFRYHKTNLHAKKTSGKKPKAQMLVSNSYDGGEKDAGAKLLGVLKNLEATGLVLVVSRWFGGQNLGNKRFDYITNSAYKVLAKAGYGGSVETAALVHKKRKVVVAPESDIVKATLTGMLGAAIIKHAEAMVPARQDGALSALQGHPQFGELLSDLTPERISVRLLSRLAVSFNTFTTRGLPNFWSAYGVTDEGASMKQWGGGLARSKDGEDEMLKAWRTHKSTPNECTVLFVALCRALGLSVRLVVALDPQGIATAVGGQGAMGGGGGASAALGAGDLTKRLQRSNESAMRVQASSSSNDRRPTTLAAQTPIWAEVYATPLDRWVAVDPVHAICDVPEKMLELWFGKGSNGVDKLKSKGPGRGPSYVVSVSCCPMLRVTEVSKRYLREWFNLVGNSAKRIHEGWWSDCLAQVSCAADQNGAVRAMEADDEEKMHAAALAHASKNIPGTIAGLKKSPLYCLKTHLKQAECLRPGARVAGFHEGEGIYKREDVQELRTDLGWRKKARQVKEGEEPHSTRPKQKTPGHKQADAEAQAFAVMQNGAAAAAGAAATSDDGASDEKEHLFGTWQTEVYKPPVAKDGVIPVNLIYGNVELWEMNMDLLPGGCRHIDAPWIQKTCVDNGIKFAEAMTGYEFSKTGTKPKIVGIVVLEEDYERLCEAHTGSMAVKKEKSKEKADGKLFKRWGALIKLAVMQKRVQAQYS